MAAIDNVTDFIAMTSWSDLPPAIQTKSVSCLLDSLGATLVGAKTSVAQIADTYAREHLKGDGATILGSGAKVSAMGAAFANAVAANGTDIDDCGIYTGGHPGAQVFPTALALAEELHRSGRELLPIGIQWKQYSCCGWNDPTLYATEHLMRTCSIPVEQITRIHIVCHRDAYRLGTRLPETTEEAQFNLAWPIACLLLHGEVRPEHVLEDNLTDPETRALAGIVDLEESPEFTRLLDLSNAGDPAGAEYADVTIELADGRTFASGRIQGSDYDDWPAEEVESKFRWVLKETLEEAPIEDILAMVRGLPECDDVSDFVRELPLRA